jgi:anaerobic selenocysteine-containing dehydrogenase
VGRAPRSSIRNPELGFDDGICNWHKDFAHAFTYGVGIGYPDYANADTIVLWGFNPSSVWLDQATQVAAARARGAKTIVVDPRQFGFANGADHWLRVRPGADGILMLGITRLLVESGRYNRDFVRRWTNAALLVRDDNGEFLRESDITGAGSAFIAMTEDGKPLYVERNNADAG